MKICIKCKLGKEITEYYKNRNECKECHRKDARERGKRNYQKNRKKILEQNKKSVQKNKERVKKYKKEYYLKHKKEISEKGKKKYEDNKEYIKERVKNYRINNKEKVANGQRKWREDNKEKIKKYRKEWLSKPKNKIIHNLRTRNNKIVNQKKVNKNNSMLKLLGCSKEFLEKWILWNCELDNLEEYEIDHVIPLAGYDIDTWDKVRESGCNHWTNLKPLQPIKNLEKGDRIDKKIIFEQKLRIKVFTRELEHR